MACREAQKVVAWPIDQPADMLLVSENDDVSASEVTCRRSSIGYPEEQTTSQMTRHSDISRRRRAR